MFELMLYVLIGLLIGTNTLWFFYLKKQQHVFEKGQRGQFSFDELFHAFPVPLFYKKKGEKTHSNKTFMHAFDKSSTEIFEKLSTLPKGAENTLELAFDNGIKKNVMVYTANMLDKNKDITGLAGVLFDISPLWKNKEHLLAQKQRLELALEGAEAGFWDWDMKSDTFFYSPKWKSIMGYQPNESPNLLSSWLNLVHSKDMAMVNQQMKKHLDGESPSLFIEHRIRNSEPLRWVRIQGKIIVGKNDAQRMVGTIQDVSLLKHEEEAERKYKKLFLSFVDYFPAIAFIKDLQGKYLYINHAYQKYIGFQTWKGKNAEDLFGATLAEKLIETDRLAFYDRIIEHDVTLVTQEGVKEAYKVYKFPIETEEGEKLLCGFGTSVNKPFK